MSGVENTLGNNATSSAVDDLTGQTAGQFAASLVTSLVIFFVQFLAFLLIKDRFARIYQPRTYLVPERERTSPVAPGWFTWIKQVLSTSNSEFVQKCGLDAYFFLRYLRTLIKIFVPAAIVILPILLPLNAVDGRGADFALYNNGSANVTGLDQLAWGNVRPTQTHRYWAHWILALMLIVYVCYIAFDELRNYIRMRQAYITSPQHRLRASATTVLVSAIPQKWLSVEALDGLYDVFPGGLRNIWINRNFDELSEKVQKRDKLARTLESAETALIKQCFKKHQEAVQKADKEAGRKLTKEERKRQTMVQDEKGRQQAQSSGIASGDPHQVKHTVREALGEDSDTESDLQQEETAQEVVEEKTGKRVPLIGEGIHAIGHGFNQIGRGIIGGIRGVNRGMNEVIDTTNGFVAADQEATPNSDTLSSEELDHNPYGTQHPAVHDASPRSVDTTENQAHPDNDQIPLAKRQSDNNERAVSSSVRKETKPLSMFQKCKKILGIKVEPEEYDVVDYPSAFNTDVDSDDADATWRKYLAEKDRNTMRLPVFGWQWMPSLPLVGQKVDTIYYCRKEVARLNVEIEDDQAHPERFPLMNSAFIQFNHQVAAHMACQAVSHHLPKHMAPRIVEIDPNDVIWDNMSIPWWQSYIRTAGVVATVIGMIILWAVPVAFTSALSQLSTAAKAYHWLNWILKAPPVILSILQGVLSPALLALLMFLLPVTLRFLSRIQGMQSGVMVELSVQKYYFFFLFVQIFLVVTIASSIVTFFSYFSTGDGFTRIPSLLGTNIPRASNYFFSYMLLQALSVSAGALVQIGGLVGWFILAPLFDNTARAKFVRQTQLSNIQWGTFFPVYTNLACIGLIYSVVSPLILVFNIITFTLFWFVYRYQTLYVTKFDMDTGGLLFPNAINTTFVGLYVMELALVGMFFLVRNENGDVACTGQGIGMIVILILTAGYQILLHNAFSPLYRYLPITLEDDAVKRDEEFARALRRKHGQLDEDDDVEDDDIEDRLEEQERNSLEEDSMAQQYELQQIEKNKQRRSHREQPSSFADGSLDLQNPEITLDVDREHRSMRFMRKTAHKTADATLHKVPGLGQQARPRSSWADRNNTQSHRFTNSGDTTLHRNRNSQDGPTSPSKTRRRTAKRRSKPPQRQVLDKINNFNPLTGDTKDLEAQQRARSELADALFSGISDELEDLTPDERDALVQRAFQHAALRARRPVIWIPRDELGVSDDEVIRMGRFSDKLWVSNVRQGLDSKGKCVYSGAPPDFSEVDVIKL